MLRRWFIRTLFTALWLLCAAAWIASHFHTFWLGYIGRGNVMDLNLECGAITFQAVQDPVVLGDRWLFYHRRANVEFLNEVYAAADYRFMGFARHWQHFPDDHSVVVIPLWFPTLLAAALAWYAWRRTQPHAPGKAFPVEPAASAE